MMTNLTIAFGPYGLVITAFSSFLARDHLLLRTWNFQTGGMWMVDGMDGGTFLPLADLCQRK